MRSSIFQEVSVLSSSQNIVNFTNLLMYCLLYSRHGLETKDFQTSLALLLIIKWSQSQIRQYSQSNRTFKSISIW